MGPSPKQRDRSCVQPKEVRSAGACRQPEGGKELLPGFPWGADSKINCFEGNNSASPRTAQGPVHGSRRGGQEAEPTYPNPHLPPGRAAGRVSCCSSGERGPQDWFRHPCDGAGVIPGAGRDPFHIPAGSAAALGAVTSPVPPLSPRQRNEASRNLK